MPRFFRRVSTVSSRPAVRLAARPAIAIGFCLLLAGCIPQAPEVTVITKPAEEGAGTAEGGAAKKTESAAEAGYGNLTGTVTFKGEHPEPPVIVRKGDGGVKDAAVCAAETIPDEGVIVDPATKGIANVVIFLDKKPANIKPELAAVPKDAAIFDQKGCKFFPHVLLVRVGQPLLVKSEDPIAHNTHTYPVRNTGFNQAIKGGDRDGVPCNYSKSENGPIEVKCDLHTWMRAYHFPVDHPYAALTDKQGKFTISGLPAGKHVFKVWQEKGPGDGHLLERKLEVVIKADADTTQDLSYGSDRFAVLPRPATRIVSYSRLQRGGAVAVTEAGGQR